MSKIKNLVNLSISLFLSEKLNTYLLKNQITFSID